MLPGGFQLPAQAVCAAQAAAQTALQEAKACSESGKVKQVRGQRWAGAHCRIAELKEEPGAERLGC